MNALKLSEAEAELSSTVLKYTPLAHGLVKEQIGVAVGGTKFSLHLITITARPWSKSLFSGDLTKLDDRLVLLRFFLNLITFDTCPLFDWL